MIKVLTRKFANKSLQDSVFFQLYHFSGSIYKRIYSYELLLDITDLNLLYFEMLVLFVGLNEIQRIEINSASIN